MKVIVTIYKAKNHQFGFRVKTANGRITLSPAETYIRRGSVRRAVETLRDQATYDPDGEWIQRTPLSEACQLELDREAAAWAKRKVP